MRRVREISAEEENFRAEADEVNPNIGFIRRNPVKPEPEGTLVLVAFRIAGYDSDCDGSLMARLQHVDLDGKSTGWTADCVGLYPDSELVITEEELRELRDKTDGRIQS